jgi:lipid-binding SYLF domain-containing protein
MKRLSLLLAVANLILFPLAADAAEAPGYAHALRVFKRSPVVKPYFESAYGYAVFPTIGKGAFYLGAAYGDGQVYRKQEVTGKSKMVQLSLGLQMGGRAFSQIIFFQDQRAYDDFTSGNFEFDASASVTAVTAEAQARASTTGNTAGASAGPATAVKAETTYHKGMATFVHAKGGLMFDISLGGQKFSFEPL